MEPAEFSASAPGQLVRERNGWAFVPDPLPPALAPDWQLSAALEEVRDALLTFVGATQSVSNLALIVRPSQQREAIASSSIEGTQTRVRELVLAGSADDDSTVPEDSDLREVFNYRRALEQGQQWISDGRPLNLALIRGLHAVLMQGVRGQRKHPGAFRTDTVAIGGSPLNLRIARFVPPPAEQVLPLMDGLAAFVQGERAYHPLVDCALFHYQFETIHPFEDGNGRLGRLLISLFLQTRGVIDRPILYLSPYFDAHRSEYLRLLHHVSTNSDWIAWIRFFLRAVRSEADASSARIRRMLALHEEYRARVRGTTRATMLALDPVFQQVVVTIPAISKAAGVTYPTAKAAVDRLRELGIVVRGPHSKRGQLWVAEELLQSVYET